MPSRPMAAGKCKRVAFQLRARKRAHLSHSLPFVRLFIGTGWSHCCGSFPYGHDENHLKRSALVFSCSHETMLFSIINIVPCFSVFGKPQRIFVWFLWNQEDIFISYRVDANAHCDRHLTQMTGFNFISFSWFLHQLLYYNK